MQLRRSDTAQVQNLRVEDAGHGGSQAAQQVWTTFPRVSPNHDVRHDGYSNQSFRVQSAAQLNTKLFKISSKRGRIGQLHGIWLPCGQKHRSVRFHNLDPVVLVRVVRRRDHHPHILTLKLQRPENRQYTSTEHHRIQILGQRSESGRTPCN